MTQAARSLVTAAVLLVAYTLPTRAQEKPFHGWVLLGMGAGAANVACTSGGCPSGWKPGPTLLLTLGAMLTPHLGVGVGLDKWWRDPADTVDAVLPENWSNGHH